MLISAAFLCLVFAGCQAQEAKDIDYSEIPYNTVENTKSGTAVSLGMSQRDVEGLLGSVQKNAKGWYSYDDGIFIHYKDNTVNEIALQGAGIWTGKYGLTTSAPSVEVWRLYGEVEPQEVTIGGWTAPSLVYYFNNEGLAVKSKEDSAYAVYFMLTEELDQVVTLILSNEG